VLYEGCHLGAISQISGQPQMFFAKAKSNLRVLLLPKKTLQFYRQNDWGLNDTLTEAENWLT
jgi:hypothetical protein